MCTVGPSDTRAITVGMSLARCKLRAKPLETLVITLAYTCENCHKLGERQLFRSDLQCLDQLGMKLALASSMPSLADRMPVSFLHHFQTFRLIASFMPSDKSTFSRTYSLGVAYASLD